MLSRFILFLFQTFFIILFAVLVVDFVSCSIFLYEYSSFIDGFSLRFYTETKVETIKDRPIVHSL